MTFPAWVVGRWCVRRLAYWEPAWRWCRAAPAPRAYSTKFLERSQCGKTRLNKLARPGNHSSRVSLEFEFALAVCRHPRQPSLWVHG